MSWYELRGQWGYKAGAVGTPAIPKGAQIIRIGAHSAAGGSFTMNGGDPVPVIAGAATLILDFHHLSLVAQGAAAIVFTNTDHYYVEYVVPNS